MTRLPIVAAVRAGAQMTMDRRAFVGTGVVSGVAAWSSHVAAQDRAPRASCKILFDVYHQQMTEGNLIPNFDAAWDEVAYVTGGGQPWVE
jgi:hypothetical protein